MQEGEDASNRDFEGAGTSRQSVDSDPGTSGQGAEDNTAFDRAIEINSDTEEQPTVADTSMEEDIEVDNSVSEKTGFICIFCDKRRKKNPRQ